MEASTSKEPIPSFQDIDSDSAESESNEEADALSAAADAAFTDDEVDEMVHVLRERGLFAFIKLYVEERAIPIKLLLLPFGVMLSPEVTDLTHQLRILKIACSRVLRNREKLEEYNTIEDAISLIGRSKNIVVLTGAGVSTSCGIPDFRSSTGLYARLKSENWELDEPQQMFDLSFFKEKPEVFYSFAKEIYPSNFVPSPCHRFVRLLEINGSLLRNYTQNIDGLFESVGVKAMLNCHGSFATASCIICKAQFPGSAIEADVFAQQVPLCPLCTAESDALALASSLSTSMLKPVKKKKPQTDQWNEEDNDDVIDEDEGHSKWWGKPIIKPDIVFFGENLSDEFDRRLLEDREKIDLLIVIGTSLRVSPVSTLVAHVPHSVPQILINRDEITHANFDIVLLGDADIIVKHIISKLSGSEWDLNRVPVASSSKIEEAKEEIEFERIHESWVTLFPGAVQGRWVEAVRRAYGGEETEDEDVVEGQVTEQNAAERLSIPELEVAESRSRSRSEGIEDIVVEDNKKQKMQ